MCNDVGFFDDEHAFDYFDVDVALVVNFIHEVILVDDFFRDGTQQKFHIFWIR